MVFPLAITPKYAELFFHWAKELSGDRFLYQMILVGDYSLQFEEGIRRPRHNIDNFPDWGNTHRKA